jgi:hypothetical protein
MLDKPLDQITHADLDQFVQEKWPEGKTFDYKRDLYGGNDEAKRELLKDVSSFANTEGGDLLVGVDEDKGLPTGIPGVTVPDVDKEKLRLDEIIRRGLEPRIDFAIHAIPTPTGTTVFIIRVKESLLFPHRVVFQGKFGEFWARSSAGKYSMDTSELRRAFTLSETIYERIRAFRQERVAQVARGETPMPVSPGGKLILHLIPVSSFRSRQMFEVRNMPQFPTQFLPLGSSGPGSSGWSHRLNLDGLVSFSKGRQENISRSFTQFFRNGVVEAILSDVVSEGKEGKLLLAGYLEPTLLKDFRRFLISFKEVGITPPIWAFLTITGVKGARIPTENHCTDNPHVIDRDTLSLPEFTIEDLAADLTTLLRPSFDLVWNASGFARSRNFDQNGKWISG